MLSGDGMEEYFHSVRLAADRCKGCVNCIKRCPTEAIRIRGGKARIMQSRCIDCGECIRRCANRAKTAITDNLSDLEQYKYNIALPAPTLYAQFSPDIEVRAIIKGLLALGFDEVYEVAKGAEYVSAAVREYIAQGKFEKPAISSACPAVVKLIQVKFPELIDHLIPLDAPVEVAANLARVSHAGQIPSEDIGVWFITPCPAKMTAVRQPLAGEASAVTGTISISEIYGRLLKLVTSGANNVEIAEKPDSLGREEASSEGIGWAIAGGESAAVVPKSTMIVHEIHSVSDVLEQIALGKLKDVEYIEALACSGGCIGGPLTVENRFVAEHNMRKRLEHLQKQEELQPPSRIPSPIALKVTKGFEPRSGLKLDEDIVTAMKKLELMQETLRNLPGLDCGSCGSPSCQALAEDIVQGAAREADCVFKLRERVRDMAREMVDLAEKLPQSMEKNDAGREGGDGI